MSDDGAETREMTFWEHFGVLRRYILIGGFFFFACAAILFGFAGTILTRYLLAPLHGVPLVFLTPTGPFFFEIHISFLMALLPSFPLWLFLLLRFAGGALPQHKRVRFLWFVFVATLLGFISLVLSYRYLVPTSFAAFSHYIVPGTTFMLTADSYVNFVLLVTSVCFVIVELPVVIVALAYIGAVDPRWLSRNRRYLYLAVLILLGIITPTTDVVTLLAVCIPGVLFTELGLTIAKFVYTLETS